MRSDKTVTVANAGQRDTDLSTSGDNESRNRSVVRQYHARIGLVEEAVRAIAIVTDAPEGIVVDDGARVEDEQLNRNATQIPYTFCGQITGQHLVVAEDVPSGVFGHCTVGSDVSRGERNVHVVVERKESALIYIVASYCERHVVFVHARKVRLLDIESVERAHVGGRDDRVDIDKHFLA